LVLGYEHLEHFFQTVAVLMSNMVREAVSRSLECFVAYIERYSDGNDFGAEFTDDRFPRLQLMTLLLESDGAKVSFKPSLSTFHQTLKDVCLSIIAVASNLPRVESKIFPALDSSSLFLSSFQPADEPIQLAYSRIDTVVARNSVGPNAYLSSYAPFLVLLAEKNSKSKVSLLLHFI
jgi:hypothetical protein